MSTPPIPTLVGSPDDWPFWELVYSDPELASWDLPHADGDPAPAPAAGAGPEPIEDS